MYFQHMMLDDLFKSYQNLTKLISGPLYKVHYSDNKTLVKTLFITKIVNLIYLRNKNHHQKNSKNKKVIFLNKQSKFAKIISRIFTI